MVAFESANGLGSRAGVVLGWRVRFWDFSYASKKVGGASAEAALDGSCVSERIAQVARF